MAGGYPAGAATDSRAPYNQTPIIENDSIAKGVVFDSLDREFYLAIPYKWTTEPEGGRRAVLWYQLNRPANFWAKDDESLHEQIREIIVLDLGSNPTFEYLQV